jgi:hypothetical protein
LPTAGWSGLGAFFAFVFTGTGINRGMVLVLIIRANDLSGSRGSER